MRISPIINLSTIRSNNTAPKFKGNETEPNTDIQKDVCDNLSKLPRLLSTVVIASETSGEIETDASGASVNKVQLPDGTIIFDSRRKDSDTVYYGNDSQQAIFYGEDKEVLMFPDLKNRPNDTITFNPKSQLTRMFFENGCQSTIDKDGVRHDYDKYNLEIGGNGFNYLM